MKKLIIIGLSALVLAGCSSSSNTVHSTAAPFSTAPATSEEAIAGNEDSEIAEASKAVKDGVSEILNGSEQSYEAIYNEYSAKMTDATPGLIEEYNTEAATNTDGIEGLAAIANAKVEVLAGFDMEGTEKMAEFMYTGGSGKYEYYEEWTGKLYAVYEQEANKIYDVYTSSITG